MTLEIFRAPNNDGTGREDWHVSVHGNAHSAQWGGFRKLKDAKEKAAEVRKQTYWDTDEGHY